MQLQNKYIPGVCNIGFEEIRMRRNTGIVALIITILLEILFVYTDTEKTVRLVIFLPATIAALGFLQSYFHFCATFGLSGLFNFKEVGTTQNVSEEFFKKQDRKTAWKIIIYSILIGLTASALAYFVNI